MSAKRLLTKRGLGVALLGGIGLAALSNRSAVAALTPAQVRQIAASWSDIVYARSGGTVKYNLDDISTGVTQIDAGVTVNGAVISGSMTITGPMRFMTTRETTIMLALVLQTRAQI